MANSKAGRRLNEYRISKLYRLLEEEIMQQMTYFKSHYEQVMVITLKKVLTLCIKKQHTSTTCTHPIVTQWNLPSWLEK